MQTTLTIDSKEFPALAGQQVGRELELELTAVVVSVEMTDQRPGVLTDPPEGDPPCTVEPVVLRADVVQTT